MELGIDRVRKLNQQYTYVSIRLHETIARKAGLSGTDHKYIGFLERGRMTAGEWSNVTGLTTGAVTGLIDRLERKSLVTREFAPEDRRKFLIVPNNENIMKLFVPLHQEMRSKLDIVMMSLSEHEINIIENYLSRAIQAMNEALDKL
jgi:DNA-binding MarR family transcriptional regulator